MADLEGRQVGRCRTQVVHERAREQVPVLVVDDALEQCDAGPVCEVAAHLTVGDQRVEQPSGVVDGRVVEHGDAARRAVDLDDGHIESPSPFTPLGAKGMGEGGGAGIHAVCAAIQDALREAGGGIVTDSFNNPERVWRLLTAPAESRSAVEVVTP